MAPTVDRPPAPRARAARRTASARIAAARIAAVLLPAVLAVGCTSERFYRRAVFDAAVMEPAEALPLVLVTADPVQVATWTPEEYLGSYPVGQTIEITWGTVWVALESEERPRCAAFPRHRLDRRLEQLLGLPPKGEPRRFVVLEVARSALHRPCFDPDPTVDRCPLQAAPDLPPDFLDWLGRNALDSYRIPDGFPWTRLGYTYDWRPGAPEYGVSEFILLKGTNARVIAIMTAEEFCSDDDAGPGATAP